VDLLEGINTLLELDIVRRELGLRWLCVNIVIRLKYEAQSKLLRWRESEASESLSHLVISLSKLLLDILLGPSSKRRKRSTMIAIMSALQQAWKEFGGSSRISLQGG
jgi:hypothetical protein